MWIDTHCHLDAGEFAGEQGAIAAAAAAAAAGVSMIVIPAIAVSNFEAVARLAAQQSNTSYALGIHPLYVAQSPESDLLALRSAVAHAMADPRFVAIGEIGLDFFVPELKVGALREKQEYFYVEQLKIARDFDFPVLLHVRRAQDIVLKHLRRIRVRGGVAHAFNGSLQQAQAYTGLGFKLGLGGAMTFTRALQIRRLAAQMPLEALVLETDAPDISPAWLHPRRNTPAELPAIGAVLAELRGITPGNIAAATTANALSAMPRLEKLM